MTTKVDNIDVLAKLSHDLRNELVVIRAATGSIRKNLSQPELIEKKIMTINKALVQIIKHLEMTKDFVASKLDVFNGITTEE